MRILVLEDDEAIQGVLHDALKRPSIECDMAGTCRAALKLLANHTYDCATLDLNLPDGDGRSVLRAIRTISRHTRIAVVSGDAHNPSVRDSLLRAGATAVFAKPFEMKDVVDFVHQSDGCRTL